MYCKGKCKCKSNLNYLHTTNKIYLRKYYSIILKMLKQRTKKQFKHKYNCHISFRVETFKEASFSAQTVSVSKKNRPVQRSGNQKPLVPLH